MSSNWLNVLPKDPLFVPDARSAEALVDVVRELAPDAEEISVINTGEVHFVSAYGNFESIQCPGCQADLSMDWFGPCMSEVFATSRFESLEVTPPCCGRATSLNDLLYFWPQGFARWHVSVRGPGRGWTSTAEIDRLAQALGVPVRIVLAHM